MFKNIRNKRILITGGTGSLGRSLINRLVKQENDIIVYSRDEGKQALLFSDKNNIQCVIGDVRDYEKLLLTFKRSRPDVVIHAAALKRIDDMEINLDECLKTNVNGTKNVANAALVSDVQKCVLVSTDKACQPINVYGASKFTAEKIFTNFDYYSDSTIFSSVRYGNVIASRGSFIPLWINLINKQKNIKVTSMDATRFLFTLEDAVDTVLNSVYNSEGGEVFVPKINSFNMKTILESLEKMYDKKINKEIIGLRIGEKIHEDMLAKTELPSTCEIPEANLLSIMPQYSNRKTRNKLKKYGGQELNSSLHLCEDSDFLLSLIVRGIKEGEENKGE